LAYHRVVKSPQRNRLLAGEPGSAVAARRLDQRHALSLPLRIVADGVAIEAESLDVGFGGMCIRADIAHGPGCEVELSVALPKRPEPIAFRAAVVWREGALAGLRFIDITPLQLWALSRVFPS